MKGLFDSHCHVTDIDDGIRCLRLARDAGVESLLCCGYDSKSNEAVVRLRREAVGMPIALGLHPWYAGQALGPVLELIRRERPVAIGECGLDGYDRDAEVPSLSIQRPAFEAQLDLAARLGLPVTIHSRWAVSEVIATLRQFPAVRGVLHAYSGSYEQAKRLLCDGWLVGLGGALTRQGSKRIRRLAEQLPLDQVLFETDAPAIGLEGVPPPLVRPHHVVEVARHFAALRGLDWNEVVERTNENAVRMFGRAVFEPWRLPEVEGEVRGPPG